MNLLSTESVYQLSNISNVVLFASLIGTIILFISSFFRKSVTKINKFIVGVLILLIGLVFSTVLAGILPGEYVEIQVENEQQENQEIVDYEEVLFGLGFEKFSDTYIWESGNESIMFNTMNGIEGLVYETTSYTEATVWAYYVNQDVGFIDNPNQDDLCEYDLLNNVYLSAQKCSEYDLEVLTYLDRGLNRVLVDFELTLDEFNLLIESILI